MTISRKRIADRTAARIYEMYRHNQVYNKKLTLKMSTIQMRTTLLLRRLRIKT